MRTAAVAVLAALALTAAGCAAGPSTSGAGVWVAAPTPTPSPSPSVIPAPPVGPGIPAYDPSRNAAADIEAALAAARGDGRPVLLVFGANWCPACRDLHAESADPEVAPVLAGEYHTVAVDIGRADHNMALTHRYVALQTIPSLAVLRADGSVLTSTGTRPVGPRALAQWLVKWERTRPNPSTSAGAGIPA
ncbi:MAG: hypothetical protein QOJ50_2653 [Cryptosporangiaceae bacterium]|nr:hypothetical protein [Cryptosporangiaceae bacterium]